MMKRKSKLNIVSNSTKNLEAKKQGEFEQTYVKALKMKEKISASAGAEEVISMLRSITPYKDSEALIREIEEKRKKFEKSNRKLSIIIAVILVATFIGAYYFKMYQKRAEQQKIEQAKIEAEKQEKKSRINSLRRELQGQN